VRGVEREKDFEKKNREKGGNEKQMDIVWELGELKKKWENKKTERKEHKKERREE
jgi:hypothetical protein